MAAYTFFFFNEVESFLLIFLLLFYWILLELLMKITCFRILLTAVIPSTYLSSSMRLANTLPSISIMRLANPRD